MQCTATKIPLPLRSQVEEELNRMEKLLYCVIICPAIVNSELNILDHHVIHVHHF